MLQLALCLPRSATVVPLGARMACIEVERTFEASDDAPTETVDPPTPLSVNSGYFPILF